MSGDPPLTKIEQQLLKKKLRKNQQKRNGKKLQAAILEFMESRKGIYGATIQDLVGFLQSNLEMECSRRQIKKAVSSLICKGQLVRKQFKPIPVSIDTSVGEKGVILYHKKYKAEPESIFPEEFREFLNFLRPPALVS